ncbi:MAG: UTP--glucose-1-phosphate uridylyltransferase [Kiritimatiellae bacterium]|nr:UTP--glucose-1-phosphate uridylyltransferase [Kiritimatiellia bacterium]
MSAQPFHPVPPPALAEPIRAAMEADGAPELVIEAFLGNVARWTAGEHGTIPVASLAPLGLLPTAEEFTEPAPAVLDPLLARSIVIKLNGGLGTSMGLQRAKSLMPVKADLTFLDIIVRQVEQLRATHHAPLPLLLMDSFSTHADTLAVLRERHPGFANPEGLPPAFVQHRVPKLDPDSRLPVAPPPDHPDLGWCPPGHADIYHALQTTGILASLLAAGYRYAFISNADNLGAILSPAILAAFAAARAPFWMEVTRRTHADRKGGHLARSAATHRLLLRESAQCPPDEVDDFQDIDRHRYFNTNNLWLDLQALDALLRETDGLPPLPLIVNRKTLDPSVPASPPAIQLEAAMGALIADFPDASAVVVPRTRFAPVKTTADLLAIRSDLYVLSDDYHLELHPSRHGIPPTITLAPRYYKLLADFDRRFPNPPPSLLRCDALTIATDRTFPPDTPPFIGTVSL